jgi:hypothetical protein
MATVRPRRQCEHINIKANASIRLGATIYIRCRMVFFSFAGPILFNGRGVMPAMKLKTPWRRGLE